MATLLKFVPTAPTVTVSLSSVVVDMGNSTYGKMAAANATYTVTGNSTASVSSITIKDSKGTHAVDSEYITVTHGTSDTTIAIAKEGIYYTSSSSTISATSVTLTINLSGKLLKFTTLLKY